MKLNYFWTDCADGSHVAVNYTVHEDRVTGSARVWSRDRRINVGRRFEIPASETVRDAAGHSRFRLEGICADAVTVELDPAALEQAGWTTNRAA